MLLCNIILQALAAGPVLSSPLFDTNTKRQWPGKCTIGIEADGADIPGGPGGANTPIHDGYIFIVGTGGVQTNFPGYQDENNGGHYYGDGGYGGVSGGTWHVDAETNTGTEFADCTITFNGATFTKSQVGEGTCDTYKGGGPFTAKYGCRCRFDCE